MAINLSSLNMSGATLVRPDVKPVSYRLNTSAIKENWNEIKSQSKDLLQVSGQTGGSSANVSMENLQVSGEVKRICNYSAEVFFRKDMPQLVEEGNYTVNGVSFTKEELEQCRVVMRAAADGIGSGIGKYGTLDYKNYAQMGIAVSGVGAYAEANLTEEQAGVVKKAMQEYNEALIQHQESILSDGSYISGDVGAVSDYYGTMHVLSDVMVDEMNKLKEKLSELTGRTYAKTAYGHPVVVQSATNRELINNVTELFSNMDIQDSRSVSETMETYKKLVTPAYTAYRPSDGSNALKDYFDGDISGFRKQLDNILMAMNYHSADYSI